MVYEKIWDRINELMAGYAFEQDEWERCLYSAERFFIFDAEDLLEADYNTFIDDVLGISNHVYNTDNFPYGFQSPFVPKTASGLREGSEYVEI